MMRTCLEAKMSQLWWMRRDKKQNQISKKKKNRKVTIMESIINKKIKKRKLILKGSHCLNRYFCPRLIGRRCRLPKRNSNKTKIYKRSNNSSKLSESLERLIQNSWQQRLFKRISLLLQLQIQQLILMTLIAICLSGQRLTLKQRIELTSTTKKLTKLGR